MSALMSRYWVNQPSTLQPDHKYHGLCVIAQRDYRGQTVVDVYPATGECSSMRLLVGSLSPGWPAHLAPIKP